MSDGALERQWTKEGDPEPANDNIAGIEHDYTSPGQGAQEAQAGQEAIASLERSLTGEVDAVVEAREQHTRASFGVGDLAEAQNAVEQAEHALMEKTRIAAGDFSYNELTTLIRELGRRRVEFTNTNALNPADTVESALLVDEHEGALASVVLPMLERIRKEKTS